MLNLIDGAGSSSIASPGRSDLNSMDFENDDDESSNKIPSKEKESTVERDVHDALKKEFDELTEKYLILENELEQRCKIIKMYIETNISLLIGIVLQLNKLRKLKTRK